MHNKGQPHVRTFCSDSPDMPLTISGAEILRKATPSSPAMAFANRVFPQPGGPCRRMPLGCDGAKATIRNQYAQQRRKNRTKAASSHQRPQRLVEISTQVLRPSQG